MMSIIIYLVAALTAGFVAYKATGFLMRKYFGSRLYAVGKDGKKYYTTQKQGESSDDAIKRIRQKMKDAGAL